MLWVWVAHSYNIHMIESLTIFTSLVVLIRPGLLACPFATGKTIAAIIAPTLSYKVEYNECRHNNEYKQHNFFLSLFFIFFYALLFYKPLFCGISYFNYTGDFWYNKWEIKGVLLKAF